MQIANLGSGISLGVVSGVCLGTFALPMKRIATWRWENTWLMYCVWSLIFVPWVLAYFTVPHLFQVFLNVPSITIFWVFTFGFGWGVGSVLFGIGLEKVGLALGTAIVLGLTSALGTLLPLLFFRAKDLTTRSGLTLVAGVTVMVVGVGVVALAGLKREESLRARGSLFGQKSKIANYGLLLCIIAGCFATMFNFALIFAVPVQEWSARLGASQANANNAVWCISLMGGFVVNAGYCSYLLFTKQSWKQFARRESSKNWVLTLAMGGIWMGGVALYGMSVTQLGSTGSSIGWAIVQSVAIISGNLCGFFTGEWKGAGRDASRLMAAGIGSLLIGIAIVARSAAL